MHRGGVRLGRGWGEVGVGLGWGWGGVGVGLGWGWGGVGAGLGRGWDGVWVGLGRGWGGVGVGLGRGWGGVGVGLGWGWGGVGVGARGRQVRMSVICNSRLRPVLPDPLPYHGAADHPPLTPCPSPCIGVGAVWAGIYKPPSLPTYPPPLTPCPLPPPQQAALPPAAAQDAAAELLRAGGPGVGAGQRLPPAESGADAVGAGRHLRHQPPHAGAAAAVPQPGDAQGHGLPHARAGK